MNTSHNEVIIIFFIFRTCLIDELLQYTPDNILILNDFIWCLLLR